MTTIQLFLFSVSSQQIHHTLPLSTTFIFFPTREELNFNLLGGIKKSGQGEALYRRMSFEKAWITKTSKQETSRPFEFVSKKLLNSKKNDYYNAKISDLETTADNSDAKTVLQCLKSVDDTRKGEDVPSISFNLMFSSIFIQMNLLTQRSKTFAMSYDKMNAMVNTLVL